MFTFTEQDARILGTGEPYTTKHGFRRMQLNPFLGERGFLDAVNYTVRVETGFQRHVPWAGGVKCGKIENFTIQKRADGNGFFPSIACQECTYQIGYLDPMYRKFTTGQLDSVSNQIVYSWEGNTLHIQNKHPENSILEFDFPPHNFGAIISVITRV